MPTYEYECTECGRRFEKFQKMQDEPLKTCPKCGGVVRRLIGTGAGVIIKGSGTWCDRESPCCGRDVRCDSPPCRD